MKFLLLLIGLIGSFSCHSQEPETKEIIEKYKGSKQIKFRYFVLKSDKKTKHGSYESFYADGSLMEKGTYYKNAKNGEWTLYWPSFKRNGVLMKDNIKESGKYKMNEKSGIWDYYKPKGEFDKRYNHDTEKEVDPMQIIYPEEALQKKVKGEVKISYKIKSNCEISDIKVLEGIGNGCDEEALRIVKFLQNQAKFSENKNCQAQTATRTFTFHL